MQNNGIPLVNVPMGPGSQEEGEMVLDYMKMPSEMDSYDIPVLPESDQAAECPQALAVLEKLQTLLDHYKVGDDVPTLVLDAMPDADLDLLNQILGEGEVSVTVDSDTTIRAQETVLAGVWRLRESNEQGVVIKESIEIADVPLCSRKYAFANKKQVKFDSENLPAGVLNAPSVLVEISEASESYQQAKECISEHVINLSLLPFSPQDHAFLSEQTGTGAVTILSRGYGNCRITSTCVDGLWRVQYFNSTDQLILDTLEITDIPQVACAAQEDLDDSAERLKEIREVLV
ncbi:hydrogenase expression/formation protein [Neptuniibacter sp.]|uniref:hydrogenase expression/formation protein n=1 Tax=Neptuniibacter sp. TaxID=1962643 RepID=UPI00260E7555|nr:hydrogenase expression/formation protein [Neptuniibacter sp.]MCP4598830.1 hydrogenase expression/formation protein [Neptuniibacter sp.]